MPKSATQKRKITIDNRKLSVIVFSMFFSWILAFPFEGQVLYAIAEEYNFEIHNLVFSCITAHFFGLLGCGFFVKTIKAIKRMILFSILFCLIASYVFFFPPSILWYISLVIASFLAGGSVAAWSFYFKSYTPSNERIKTAADGLIYSNIIMIIINTTTTYLFPQAGLALSMLMLVGAFIFALKLPEIFVEKDSEPKVSSNNISPVKPLAFLSLFIVIITINSGLMYQVLNPAFAHHEWLVSWYWAVPYIIALFVMKNLPHKANRTYILYLAIAMIGLSFLAFMIFDRSVISYLVINTLMLGACGIYDLFWWSILGEMLDMSKNPVKILGIGLSANVLGVLLGGMLGNAITTMNLESDYSSVVALAVVFAILIILPLLHQRLSRILKNHVYLTELSELSPSAHTIIMDKVTIIKNLTQRESEIVSLLMRGRTYKMIAAELYLSENTIKTHIKNIYSKLHIQSKAELIRLLMGK
ncbi:MAG: LuxR C-terminal-related transcriptional regulator [Mobilitalea sp.]